MEYLSAVAVLAVPPASVPDVAAVAFSVVVASSELLPGVAVVAVDVSVASLADAEYVFVVEASVVPASVDQIVIVIAVVLCFAVEFVLALVEVLYGLVQELVVPADEIQDEKHEKSVSDGR